MSEWACQIIILADQIHINNQCCILHGVSWTCPVWTVFSCSICHRCLFHKQQRWLLSVARQYIPWEVWIWPNMLHLDITWCQGLVARAEPTRKWRFSGNHIWTLADKWPVDCFAISGVLNIAFQDPSNWQIPMSLKNNLALLFSEQVGLPQKCHQCFQHPVTGLDGLRHPVQKDRVLHLGHLWTRCPRMKQQTQGDFQKFQCVYVYRDKVLLLYIYIYNYHLHFYIRIYIYICVYMYRYRYIYIYRWYIYNIWYMYIIRCHCVSKASQGGTWRLKAASAWCTANLQAIIWNHVHDWTPNFQGFCLGSKEKTGEGIHLMNVY